MDESSVQNLMETGSMWLPELTAKGVSAVDGLFYFILTVSTLMFVAIMGVMIYFIIKYKRRDDHQEALSQISHNTPIEIVWTVIPLLLCFVLFYWGYQGFIGWSTAPGNAEEIHVVGRKWMWQFDYPAGVKTLGEMVVPVNAPVKLIMSSEDVIHSFYIPNFRMKRDVLPNRYTTIWFEADKVGSYHIFCTEYCGDGHSNMLGVVRVVPQDEYDEWIANGGSSGDDLPLDELGEKLYTSKGCNACHTLDGGAGVGATWKGLYGSQREFTDGTIVQADENYIRESIMNPGAKIVKGYQPLMPSFAGILKDREVNALVEYIKALK